MRDEFLKILQAFDSTTHVGWADGSYSARKNGTWLMVTVKNHYCLIQVNGYGSSQPLVAITPDQLKECLEIIVRNREILIP